MSNPKKLAKALLFAGLIGAGVVIACGPDFPAQLLDDRGGTLHATPSNSFRYEAARLTPATDALRARDTDPYYQPPQAYIPEDDDPELDTTQRNAIRKMRAQADGDAAAAGAGVPEAARLYAAGAVDYLLAQREPGELGEQRLARAQRRFQAILALPAAQSVARSVGRRTCWLISGTSPAPSTTMPPRGHKPPRPTNTPANCPRRCAGSAGPGRRQLRPAGAPAADRRARRVQLY